MIRLLVTTCMLALLSSPVWAACKGKDIKGLYLAYAAGTDSGSFFATLCGFRISSSGAISSGSNCISDVTNPVRGGRLTVARDCTVTGVIETRDGDIAIPAASMTTRKGPITGVYLIGTGEGTFTAVKHKKISGADKSMARYFGE